MRLNAAVRIYGLTYSKFFAHLKHTKIELNRNVLANMAMTEPLSFLSVVQIVKERISAEDKKFAKPAKPSQWNDAEIFGTKI